MNLLAFDTSTEFLSAAVQRGDQTWEYGGPGGAQASTHLVPALLDLMRSAGLQFAELDAIAFGAGPGSFTGLRTACAVAQGLGLGAGVRLLPVPTLLAVAEEARQRQCGPRIVAALDARMDEIYVARVDFSDATSWQHCQTDVVAPEQLHVPPGWVLAGNADAVYGQRLTWAGASCAALPRAPALLRLSPALLAAGWAVDAAQALPQYIRDKVAKTTAERAAEKHAAALAASPP